jgi:hypothetical protein
VAYQVDDQGPVGLYEYDATIQHGGDLQGDLTISET